MDKLLPVIVALLLAGCSSGHQAANDAHAPAPADARQLKGSEINEALIGRQHSSVTTTGYEFKETFIQDGTAKIKIEGEPEQIGRWMIAEDVICVTYKKYGEECNTVRTDGVSIWLVDKTKNTTNNKFGRQ
ncbi:hypothetical protein [Pseudomonas fluorescens]|uniref:Lipoprotein n=1 Tax=Pseudomonas fluorescens TaxID=294 RepID=A0A5E7FZV1_PSEFL|nr:hypothetical protein [Pseudomonas fluorescens]VVO44958.1 hypothetical protein PS723_06476 [Pseudomonas fluorescens]